MADDKKPEEKHKSTIDKIVMGAIIGTAIGSALGMSLAPQKGSETRQQVGEVAKLGKETAWGFFKIAKRLLFGKDKGMKVIPDEMEIVPPKHADQE